MGLFTKTSGTGWSLDKGSGRLTISGDLGTVYKPFEKIRKMVRSVVALEGARVRETTRLFYDMKNLKSADLSKLDVSECTDLSHMFSCCESLTSIDVTGWDTSNVRTMFSMFERCESLVSVDLASLDLSSAEKLPFMFDSCEKLSYVKMGALSSAVNLVDISYMFSDCYELRKVETAGWPSKSLKECKALFNGCKSLKELDLRSMDVTNVQDISRMFEDCSNLRTLDLSGWNVRNIKEMECFCTGCKHLGTLDLRGWQINKDIYARSSFDGVPKNVRILVSDKTTQAVLYEKCVIRTEYSPVLENTEVTEEKGKGIPVDKEKAALAKSTPLHKQKQMEKVVTKASPVKKAKQQSTPVSSQKADTEDEKAALLEKLAKQQAEVDALKAQLAALQTNKEEKKAAEQKEASKKIAEEKKLPEKAKETTGQKEPLPSAVKVQAAQDPASTADQEEREAAYNLALMYTDGNGDVPKDYLKALELFCKAADQGHEKAQKILRSSGIHRAKTSYNVPVSHKPNPAEKKNYENKRHIKVAVIGDCHAGKTTLLSALSCYFSQNYPSYENYYMTREEIKEIQARGAHGLCKEHNYQHEPFYMFLEDPDFLYTFIEIPSVLDFMKNIQQGMYAADIAIYVATVQHGAANSSKYLQLALNAGIPGFIAFQTTLEPNPDQEMIDLASLDLIGAAQNLEIPLEQTFDGTHLEYQIDEKDFTLCLAGLMKEIRDEATSNVGNIAPDLPTLMSIKKVSRKRDGSLLALGVISRGTLLAGDSVDICGYYDTLIPATCAEIQIFNLSVPIANCGDFVSVRLTDLPPGFVIRAGQFISKRGCIRLANSITIEGNAPTWENGGRHTPFFTGYHPLLILGPSAVSAKVTDITDEFMVIPGTHFTLRLELDKPLPVIHGLRAVLCDGVIVGTGMISEYSE